VRHRARQLTQRLVEAGTDMTTMTRYSADLDVPVAFGEQEVQETLAEVLSEHHVRQLHVAETEKYAHVSYFFNGGREAEWGGETRVLVPSPRDVPSYDHKPEMSAGEVADRFVEEIGRGDYAFAVVNFANPDMVGHTGSIPATVKAVETVDACCARVISKLLELDGKALVTADHGNCEQMRNPDGSPNTAHTTYLVHFIYVAKDAAEFRCQDGILADVAPTLLFLLALPQPKEMTGHNLLVPA